MTDFIAVKPEDVEYNIFENNVFSAVGDDWMLITAGDENGYNTMTASWGGMGVLWNDPVSFIFVRPQRYTYTFTEKHGKYTLSFFDEKYRDALTFCGSHSGRDCDKAKEAGLTPVFEDGYTYFAEASLVLFCEKKYADDLKGENFTDKSIIGKCYPYSDFHRMYIGKITKCIKKQSD